MRDHAVAGQQHQRHAGVERHPGGGHILQDVEFLIIRPMQGAAAQPDQHHAVGYLRLHQQGGRYVGDGPDCRHVQGIFSGVLHGQLCQRLCRIGWNGRFFIGQIGGGAPVDRHVFPGQRQQLQNFLIAFLHAVGRAGGTLIMKGRGAQRQQMQPVLRAQGVGNGELVVDFIVSVGIDHHIEGRLGRFQHPEALFRRQHKASSFPGIPIVAVKVSLL